jgi:hypothetical protein
VLYIYIPYGTGTGFKPIKPRFIGGSSVADPHHLDADPDPDPAFHFDAESVRILLFNLMRILIRFLPLTFSRI